MLLYLFLISALVCLDFRNIHRYLIMLILSVTIIMLFGLFDFINIGTYFSYNDELKTFTYISDIDFIDVFPRNIYDLIGWIFYYIDCLFGVESFISLKLCSSFFGLLLTLLLVHIYEIESGKKVQLGLFCLIAFMNPSSSFYYFAVRDIALVLLNTLALYLVIYREGKSNLILLPPLLLLISTLRFENVIFIVFSIFFYQIFFQKKINVFFKSLTIITLTVSILYTFEFLYEYYQYKVKHYHEDMGFSNSDGLANSLRSLPVPINFFTLGIFGYLGPIPSYRVVDSPFLTSSTIDGLAHVSGLKMLALSKIMIFFNILFWQYINLKLVLTGKIRYILGNNKYAAILLLTFIYSCSVGFISITYDRFIPYTTTAFIYLIMVVNKFRSNVSIKINNNFLSIVSIFLFLNFALVIWKANII